jgi:UDP-glucose 4-epimerase
VDVKGYRQLCYDAMNDDLNTPIVISHLFDMAKVINTVNDRKATLTQADIDELKSVMDTFVFTVMGLRDEAAGDNTALVDGLMQMILDVRATAKANKDLNVCLLRYFNPIGGHTSGLLGEDPNGLPNNLMPYVTQVAIGKLPFLRVFGNDYKTVDGTGVRDYIHVVDLAKGHVAALKRLESNPGLVVYNLGTGKGTSVLELVHAFEEANGIKIPYQIMPRRPGDIDENFANVDKAWNELGWKATLTIKDACKDPYHFQKKNPNGIE